MTLESQAEQLLKSNSFVLDDLESILIEKALQQSKDNVSKAARLLGISRPSLAYRLKKKRAE
tara:strand:+ start:106 stop:291 length:186 start_codon:yes stop_codon:yes gene_type:complete